MDSIKFVGGNGYASLEDWKTKKPDEYEKMEKVYFSFEDWKNGDLNWTGWDTESGEAILLYTPENVSKIHILPKVEHQKIVAKQKEILESHIKHRLENYLIAPFKERLEQSFEPEQLIRLRLAEVEKILTDKQHPQPSLNPPSHRVLRTFNEVANLYEKILVKAQHKPRSFIYAELENDFTKDLPIADTLAYFQFKKYLEGLLASGGKQVAATSKPSKPSKNKPKTFLDYFRGNEAKKELFFRALIEMGAIDKSHNWVFEGHQNSIAACFDALQSLEDSKGNKLVKSGLNKKELHDLIKAEIETPIRYDNFRKWQFDLNTRQAFEKKLRQAFRESL